MGRKEFLFPPCRIPFIFIVFPLTTSIIITVGLPLETRDLEKHFSPQHTKHKIESVITSDLGNLKSAPKLMALTLIGTNALQFKRAGDVDAIATCVDDGNVYYSNGQDLTASGGKDIEFCHRIWRLHLLGNERLLRFAHTCQRKSNNGFEQIDTNFDFIINHKGLGPTLKALEFKEDDKRFFGATDPLKFPVHYEPIDKDELRLKNPFKSLPLGAMVFQLDGINLDCRKVGGWEIAVMTPFGLTVLNQHTVPYSVGETKAKGDPQKIDIGEGALQSTTTVWQDQFQGDSDLSPNAIDAMKQFEKKKVDMQKEMEHLEMKVSMDRARREAEGKQKTSEIEETLRVTMDTSAKELVRHQLSRGIVLDHEREMDDAIRKAQEQVVDISREINEKDSENQKTFEIEKKKLEDSFWQSQ